MASLKAKKLSSKEESEICLSCGECCKKYWITILPNEAKSISALIKKPMKRFLWEDCYLNVKLYPKSVKGKLTFSSDSFPERIKKLITNSGEPLSLSYFIVPQLVLKRGKTQFKVIQHGSKIFEDKNECVFLEQNNKCSIYKERPVPCRLFPFIAMAGLREQYPFCDLFKKTFKDFSKESKKYYSEIQNYFDSIDAKGIESVFLALPKKGFIYLQESFLGELSIEELLKMTSDCNKV